MSSHYQQSLQTIYRNILLAVAYILLGKLGLMLAVPPGYATVIWPPSGLALGMLLLHGLRLWPGIFIGSFLLNAGFFETPFFASMDVTKFLLAAIIATGSTLQACVGREFIRRFFGLPLSFNRVPQIFLFIIVAGPLSCIIAASIGVSGLYLTGSILIGQIWQNLVTWWAGDILGIWILLPLILIIPGKQNKLIWRGGAVGTLSTLGLLLLIVPLVLTFYVWKITTEYTYEKNNAHFETLIKENERAFIYRLESYKNALLSGASFFSVYENVTREQWKDYVQTLDIQKNFPGMGGMGYIQDVSALGLDSYINKQRETVPGFKVLYENSLGSSFIVTYIEPSINYGALGLNIAYEKNRYQAALLARDTGRAVITKKITLLNDTDQATGFLLLQPIYQKYAIPDTVERRRASFLGWVFAPFNISNFMSSFSQIKSQLFHLKIYEGTEASIGNLVFDSRPASEVNVDAKSSYTFTHNISILQQNWILVWSSTTEFDASVKSIEPLIVMIGGLSLSFMFAIFLLMLTQREKTVQKLVQQKTREIVSNKDQLRLLIQHTPAAVAMLDKDMRYIMASNRWMTDYNLKDRNIVGLSHYDVFPEIKNMPEWIEIHKRVQSGEIHTKEEHLWTRADGVNEWIRYDLHPWVNANDEIGGIVMFTEVITKRKEMEEALKASEETFRSAMEYSPIGIALLYPNGRWMKANKALCNFLGFEEKDLLQIDFQILTHPDDLEKGLEKVQDVLSGKIQTYQMEKRYIHKNGHILWGILSVALVRDSNGAPKYFVAQIHDITELKEIARLKDEFISVVSHELRTPVTSINLSLNMLESSIEENASSDVKNLIDMALRNCARLMHMVNDVLDLRKISVGKMTYDMKEENLAKLVHQVVKDNGSIATYHNVTFLIEPKAGPVRVIVDTHRFSQVITNFLSNAAKFTTPGDIIRIYWDVKVDSVVLFVEDHGQGIPEDFKKHIFEKFSQADSSMTRKTQGSGLGLHISKEMIENMGGTIGFTSIEGRGTAFWVELPRLP